MPYPGMTTTRLACSSSCAAPSTVSCFQAFCSPVATVFWTVPNAPNRTLVNERFMARHMMIERIRPLDPSSAPAVTSSLLPSTNPIATAERPAYEFRIEMTVGMSILNSYAGLSAVAMGFVLGNKLLVTAGALDGSSGLILSIIMCRAMNRSFTNVLFGAFGTVQKTVATGEQKAWKQETVEGAAQLLEQASLVVVIPGYGMAVAQAQHRVRELYDQLTKRGITVKFAIHPVAGRMPGHMNVLLAEANIPYTALVEMEEINPDMPQCDVALVIGANDVVNPAARYAKGSPISGMPIIDADKAKTVLAIKRSKNPGFAGIDNELYVQDNAWMLFGDAKAVIGDLAKQLAGGSGLH